MFGTWIILVHLSSSRDLSVWKYTLFRSISNRTTSMKVRTYIWTWVFEVAKSYPFSSDVDLSRYDSFMFLYESNSMLIATQLWLCSENERRRSNGGVEIGDAKLRFSLRIAHWHLQRYHSLTKPKFSLRFSSVFYLSVTPTSTKKKT